MKEVITQIKNSKSVAIFGHENPDWDCIGSGMALRNALRNSGIKADVFTEKELSKHLSFLETDVITFSEDACAPDYDCYCVLDVNSTGRIGSWGKFLDGKENIVCVDHHHASGEFAKVSHIEPSRSSTGELVYELLTEGGFEITKDIAEYIYCAMSSDTGSFKYASVNRRTYEILIALSETGINTTHLCSMLYERKSITQLKLQAELINTIKLYKGGTIATARITNAILEKHGASFSDTEALADIPRSIDGVMISAFLKELPSGDVRVSLRSLGDFNIEPVARKFGGGGHKKASGCTFKNTSIDDAERALVEELEKL